MLPITTLPMNLLMLLCIVNFSSEKRLRLPILLRTPKIDCSFSNDECGINQNLDHFDIYQNSTYIAGRCQYYQFAIKDNQTPIQVARFRTSYFPNLDSTVGCLHLEYNVQGINSFLFVVSKRTNNSLPCVIFSSLVSRATQWKSTDIEVQLCPHETQFFVEVLCQWCTKGSTFSVSRISFSWESCQS